MLYEVITADPQAAIDDVEMIIRKDVRLVYETAKRANRIPRDVAEEIFAPDTFDGPDI